MAASIIKLEKATFYHRYESENYFKTWSINFIIATIRVTYYCTTLQCSNNYKRCMLMVILEA